MSTLYNPHAHNGFLCIISHVKSSHSSYYTSDVSPSLKDMFTALFVCRMHVSLSNRSTLVGSLFCCLPSNSPTFVPQKFNFCSVEMACNNHHTIEQNLEICYQLDFDWDLIPPRLQHVSIRYIIFLSRHYIHYVLF